MSGKPGERAAAVLRRDPEMKFVDVAVEADCSPMTAVRAAHKLGIKRGKLMGAALAHQRWHVGRGAPDPDCTLCWEEGHPEPLLEG